MERLLRPFAMRKRTTLTIILLFVFTWSLFAVEWNSELLHSGGKATLMQMVTSIFQPDFSPEIIKLAISSTWITVGYAVAGVSLAILIAFIFGIAASGILANSKKAKFVSTTIFRGLLNFMRAIHELVWAWLFVAAFGLSPFAAIFALAIPYGGILGKIFADQLNDVPNEPINALKSAGASRLQCLFYGYLPIVRSNMISYTMYRFECGIRSSAIMSFVGLGGLGYQIQLSLDDLHYNEVWTFLIFLIGIVVLIDMWSNFVRKGLENPARNGGIVTGSFLFSVFLLIFGWGYIFLVQKANLFELFSEKTNDYTVKFLKSLVGIGEEEPAFASWENWKNAIMLTYDTLRMSILAIGLATITMLLTVLPAARNVASGSITLSRRWYGWISFGIVRIIYIVSRAVPELIWAMMIIFIFKPGILPGAIALALHNFGILGKLCAEVIEDLDSRPIKNLASSGANRTQLLFYGIFPTVMPKFMTYILYRWEVIMRTTIVVGFVSAGGLGTQFKLSMSFFHYSDITLLLLCYLVLVFGADIVSEKIRKLVK
jgi:phosphonate transport system permease protein